MYDIVIVALTGITGFAVGMFAALAFIRSTERTFAKAQTETMYQLHQLRCDVYELHMRCCKAETSTADITDTAGNKPEQRQEQAKGEQP